MVMGSRAQLTWDFACGRMPMMLRAEQVLHYFLLAALLVGLPLACCVLAGYDGMLADVKAFPPDCRNWAHDPTRLWPVKCPFKWWAFTVGLVVVVGMSFPFAGRFIKALSFRRESVAGRHPFPFFGWVGVAILVFGWTVAWTRFDCLKLIQRYPYAAQWAGFILVVNALCVKRSGSSPLTTHTKAYLLSFPVSSAFWWFFEYLNRYVWNWYYVGVPQEISAFKYILVATVFFSTVIPGIVAVAALLGTFRAFSDETYSGMAKVNVRSHLSVCLLVVIALVGLTGVVFIPQFTFPLLWYSPLAGFVLIQVLLGEKSVFDVLRTGSWGIVVRFAVAALVCGFVWETWNYYSLTKWVYNVPWVTRFHIWEMPLIGYSGYLPFGLECAAVAAWMNAGLVGLPLNFARP